MVTVATDQGARMIRQRIAQASEVRTINGHAAVINWHWHNRPLSAQCAWCGDVRVGMMWEKRQPISKDVTHGICPACALGFSHGKN